MPVHVDAVTAAQLAKYRSRFVPARPVTALPDVVPILVVQADAVVMPLTHGLDARFALGAIGDARLSLLARRWLAGGRPDQLAELCEWTWEELAGDGDARESLPAIYWYEEVAKLSRAHAPKPMLPMQRTRPSVAPISQV